MIQKEGCTEAGLRARVQVPHTWDGWHALGEVTAAGRANEAGHPQALAMVLHVGLHVCGEAVLHMGVCTVGRWCSTGVRTVGGGAPWVPVGRAHSCLTAGAEVSAGVSAHG